MVCRKVTQDPLLFRTRVTFINIRRFRLNVAGKVPRKQDNVIGFIEHNSAKSFLRNFHVLVNIKSIRRTKRFISFVVKYLFSPISEMSICQVFVGVIDHQKETTPARNQVFCKCQDCSLKLNLSTLHHLSTCLWNLSLSSGGKPVQ